MENIKKFFSDKKNIAIVILSYLLFLSFITIGYFSSTQQVDEIEKLNSQITKLDEEKQELNTKITKLEEEKKKLNDQISKLEDKQPGTSETESTSSSTSAKNNSSSTKATSSTTNNSSSASDSKSEMVWVGNSGTKYHTQSCRTLKGNGYQISLNQALKEGRQACKVCH